MKILLGHQSYKGRSKRPAGQRVVNLYAEANPPGSKYPFTLYNTSGLVEFADLGTTKAVDGMQKMGDLLYAVSGNEAFKVTTAGVKTSLGNISGTVGRVDLSNNGTQMTIINPDGLGFVATSSTVTSISDGDFPTSSATTFLDGYTIVSKDSSGQFNISSLLDSTAWDADNFATAEEAPDNLVRPFGFNSALWLFGETSYEVYYNSGNKDFPFKQISGAVNTTRGLGAKFSVAQEDNSLLFLGDDRIVYKVVGYTPVRISTHYVESQLEDYTVISDAFGFVADQDGHKFYVLSFPSEDKTWVYDLSNGLWHERMTFSQGKEHMWRANCYEEFAGKKLVGDNSNGKIYELDPTTYTEDGNAIRGIAEGITQWADDQRFIFDAIRLDIDTGVGLITGQGSDPQVSLQYSDDGGETFSNELWRSFGKIGKYKTRPIWRRKGQSRERIFRFVITDPVPRRISGAYVEGRLCRT